MTEFLFISEASLMIPVKPLSTFSIEEFGFAVVVGTTRLVKQLSCVYLNPPPSFWQENGNFLN